MRVNRRSEIAISILSACARTPSRTIRTIQVAEAANASKDHTAQVVCALVQAGFLYALRGRNGGIRLAVAAEEILLGDVLRQMQPDATRCAGPTETLDAGFQEYAFASISCAANATYLSFMDRFSIADLVKAATNNDALCLERKIAAPPRWAEPLPQQASPNPRQAKIDHQKDRSVRILVAEQARMGTTRNNAFDFG